MIEHDTRLVTLVKLVGRVPSLPPPASHSLPGVRPKAPGVWRSSRARPTSRGVSSDPGAGLWNAREDGWGGSAA
jgi:hypothetical protein